MMEENKVLPEEENDWFRNKEGGKEMNKDYLTTKQLEAAGFEVLYNDIENPPESKDRFIDRNIIIKNK